MTGYFNKDPQDLKSKVIYVMLFAGAVFFLLTVRLWHLQALEGGYYRGLSENNRIRTIKSPAPRGEIYDRVNVKLAENRPGFDLYLVPEDVTDWRMTKERLKELAGLLSETIDKQLAKDKNRPPFRAVKLKEDLLWEEAVRVESVKFETPGVILEVSPKRNYIYGEAIAHLIGYLGEINEKELLKELKNERYDPGDWLGKYGMERSFEKELRGEDGGKELEVDARGKKIRLVRWVAPIPGNDLKLTIDVRAQMAAWAALKDKAGAAVALEPSTGRVLAIVSTPSFDPNLLSSRITKDAWQEMIDNPLDALMNRAIQGLYPPASTFKPIHAAAALEDKVITPATKIYAGPSFRFAGRDYRDWKEEGHGIINVHRAIVESSDTFFYQTGLKIGVDRLAEYSKGFGFGTKTGIRLMDEKSGIVPSTAWKRAALKARWYDGETISAAVGQGYMLTTPLQLASAYAAVANGGTLYTPQLVEEMRNPQGELLEFFAPEKRGTVKASAETLKIIKDALKGVTEEEGGTAYFLRASDLKIAGKTGTAQVLKLVKRTKDINSIPYKFRDHAWFAGYAPYDDPKIAVVVLVEHGGFGASAAAPVAREIFKAYLTGSLEEEPEKTDQKEITAKTDAGSAAGVNTND